MSSLEQSKYHSKRNPWMNYYRWVNIDPLLICRCCWGILSFRRNANIVDLGGVAPHLVRPIEAHDHRLALWPSALGVPPGGVPLKVFPHAQIVWSGAPINRIHILGQHPFRVPRVDHGRVCKRNERVNSRTAKRQLVMPTRNYFQRVRVGSCPERISSPTECIRVYEPTRTRLKLFPVGIGWHDYGDLQ